MYPDIVAKNIYRKAETINSFPFCSGRSKQQEVIINIVRVIQEHGCCPVVVSTPLHKRLLEAIDEDVLNTFDQNMAWHSQHGFLPSEALAKYKAAEAKALAEFNALREANGKTPVTL